ncbi:hypothetical protein QNI19_30000 [Cytophagaceae bacterium DM2B3-1]|uniref:Sugar-binding protein n=1 Tax=Xanthocytophaga flava TaxID=3048013 RepID=A0ABT7CTX2_9BACT|nr:hypothetical protein [Xanthocytophaga flavus]MDJ1497209.1 hypothetical protein [Xanthocytophaga flavus]
MLKQLLPYLFASLLLISSCQQDTDPTPTADETCRINDTQSITLNPNGSIDTTTSKYEYNSQGLLIKIHSTYSAGSIAVTTYTYNSEGFLTEQKTVTEGKNESLEVITYTYAEGKLSRFNTVFESASSQYTNEYSYNTDGQLLRFVWKGKNVFTDGSTSSYRDSVLSQYTNGKLTSSIQYRETDSFPVKIDKYTFETDEQGLVISRSSGDGNKDIYHYNADGELVRREHHYNNQLRSYSVYEYDTKKNIQNILTPTPKGHPASLYGGNIHNITKDIRYDSTFPDNTLEEDLSNVYEYEYNDQGYPTKKVWKYTLNGQTTLFTTTYNITCQ